MAANSKIEWTTHTFNPWIGCTKISPGCDRCYAEHMMDHRLGRVEWGPHGERKRTSEAYWRQPLHWAKTAAQFQKQGLPRPRVFCASLADVFDNQVPQEWRTDLFRLIDATPELDWLLLTKRPENAAKMLDFSCGEAVPNQLRDWPWPNIWLGFTAEDQEHFNRRWPIIREIPAVVRFCSYEPAIGPLTLSTGTTIQGLHWLICGGESGAGYRYMQPEWEENIRNECKLFGVAYFFKQLSGKKQPLEGFPLVRQFPVAESR